MLPGWRRSPIIRWYRRILQPSAGGQETTTDPGEGSIARISNRLRPQDPGGGVWSTGARLDKCMQPVDADGHRCDADGQELAEQFRPDGYRLNVQPDQPPIEAVGVDAVLVDMALELGGVWIRRRHGPIRIFDGQRLESQPTRALMEGKS